MKPETDINAPPAPIWWRVEQAHCEGPALGKGVCVRLSGSVPFVSDPSLSRLLLLTYSSGEPIAATVRAEYAPEVGERIVRIRGVRRALISGGVVALPPVYEPFCTRVGVVRAHGSGRLESGAWLRLDGSGSTPGAPITASHRLPHGLHLVVLSRPVPLVPASRLTVDSPDVGAVTVLACFPSGASLSSAAVRALVREASARPPVPMDSREQYRVLGLCPHEADTPPADDAMRIGPWWVSPALVARCDREMNALCRRAMGARRGDLVGLLQRCGVGPLLADELMNRAVERFLVRHGQRYLPAGSAPSDHLSPPARVLLQRLDEAGSAGVDGVASISDIHRTAVGRLVERGDAVRLENGRLFSVAGYRSVTVAVVEAIESAGGELHQRDLAASLGLPRNTVRALVERMARDRLVQLSSSVHVRVPHGSGTRHELEGGE